MQGPPVGNSPYPVPVAAAPFWAKAVDLSAGDSNGPAKGSRPSLDPAFAREHERDEDDQDEGGFAVNPLVVLVVTIGAGALFDIANELRSRADNAARPQPAPSG